MPFLFGELAATLLASLVLALLAASAGGFLAARLAMPGFRDARGAERLGLSLLCGLACLPVLLDLAGRAGVWPMVAAALAFAALGAPALLRALISAPGLGATAGLLLGWALLIVFLIVDMPTPDGLRHSLLIVDYVKHATAAWAIATSGNPPFNPTVYSPGGHAAYYYFFYLLTAADATLLKPFGVAARHAAFAGAILTGPALAALGWRLWIRSGADAAAGAPQGARRSVWLLLALLATTGLDIIPTLALNLLRHDWQLTPEEWNEQITSWFGSALWAPHHVAGLCAAFVGLMALTRADGDGVDAFGWRRAILAGVAFASMAGLSIYVAMGGALAAALWVGALLVMRRNADALAAIAAGFLALALAAPWIATLLVRVGGDAPPIVFGLRPFPLSDIFTAPGFSREALRAVFIPIGYLVEFGIFGLGSFLFWRKAGRAGMKTDLGLVLVLATAASLLIGSFMRSAILGNDLGWRVMLFAQAATLVWTLAAIRAGLFATPRLRGTAFACIGLGYLTILDAAAQIRINPFLPFGQPTHLAERIAAWNWLDQRLPAIAVVQENPDRTRAFDYGVYGRFPTAISDRHNSVLFGAPRAEIDRRLAEIGPIFVDPSFTPDAMRAIAARYGLSAIVLADADPVFAAAGAWPQKIPPDFRNDFARVYLLKP
ncbi:MAG: hypothetical protein KDJ25_09550 [Rhodoblastus sp.]|nr:hypothetical protein [Rhodoblastus sp.]